MSIGLYSLDEFPEKQGTGFIRAVCSPSETKDVLARIDSALSGSSGYVRITKLEPLSDMNLIERCRSESERFSADRAGAEILELYRKASPASGKTAETNILVCIMYWTERCLSGKGSARDKRKLVYSGKCAVKEYLFCYYASLIGYDVLILPPNGEPQLPEALLAVSQPVRNIPRAGSAARMNSCSDERSAAVPPRRTGTVTNDTAYPRRNGAPRQTAFTQPITSRPPQTVRSSSQAENSAPPQRELSYEELATLARSVVMIFAGDSEGNIISSASGIMIGRQGYILTNNHTICDGSVFFVRVENDDTVYRVTQIIKYHTDFDLALIRIDRELIPLRIYDGVNELARGQRICAIGSPKGMFNSVSDGIISGFRTLGAMDMIQFTAPISGGSSGGALLDLRGNVIGICSGAIKDAQNINMAVSYRQIRPFLQGFI